SSEVYGEVSTTLGIENVPIAGMAGDQQAALFGQMCRTPGMSKNTYGTGCFLLQNIGTIPRRSHQQLVTTVAWQIGGRTEYALEGSVFIGGAVVQWIRDGLGLIRTAADIEPLAAGVSDNGGVYLVPAFAGLGAPHWDPYARGTIVGITRGTTSRHIARAALESIAYEVPDLLDAMAADAVVTPVGRDEVGLVLRCALNRRRSQVKPSRAAIAGLGLLAVALPFAAQDAPKAQVHDLKTFTAEMRWRAIGPFRGGRTKAITGV